MTLLLLLGYVPLVLTALMAGIYFSSRGNGSAGAKELGDRVGRRSGLDRRQTSLDFVGADRRSGVERRAAETQRAERAA